MTADPFERRVPELLSELSLPSVPDYFDDILGQTAGMRQRPGWTFPERWLPMDITLQAPAGVSVPPWRTLGFVALLILAIAIVLVAIGAPRARPAPLFGPAANGSIAYARDGDLYVADPALQTERLLVGGDPRDDIATFSRDGTAVFFGRETSGGVTVMTAAADGRDLRELATLVPAPIAVDLAPDGRRLAMIQVRSGVPTLAIVDLDGGSVRTLSLGAAVPTDYVAWRPPGAHELIFLANPTGDTSSVGLYRIRDDDKELTPLAIQNGERPRSQVSQQSEMQISFQGVQLSDDGARAAFWNWEPQVAGERTCYVHFVDLTRGGDQRVTYDPEAACEMAPHFLLGGGMVLERQDTLGYGRLLVAPTPGGSFRLIGPQFHRDVRLGWAVSPDGEWIALVHTVGMSDLISIPTGSTVQGGVKLAEIVSWQRLAPSSTSAASAALTPSPN